MSSSGDSVKDVPASPPQHQESVGLPLTLKEREEEKFGWASSAEYWINIFEDPEESEWLEDDLMLEAYFVEMKQTET